MERLVIEREINGETHFIALTEHEMNKVYDMVQHHWDKVEVMDWFDCFGDEGQADKYTDEEIDRIAYIKGSIEGECGLNWVDATEAAVQEFEQERVGVH